MNKSNATSWRINIRPVSRAGHGSTHCAGQAYGYRGIGRPLIFVAAVTNQIQNIERKGHGPCAYREVLENNVQRLAQPRTIQEVSGLLRTRSSAAIQKFVELFLQSLVD